MEKVSMRLIVKNISIIFLAMTSTIVSAHDTTHIHPLITEEIAKLILNTDSTNNAYQEIYVERDINDPKRDPNITAPQRLYWGTDFDPVNFATTNESPIDYYQHDDTVKSYNHYSTVMDGVVNEDVPVINVFNHFYHARSGIPLTVTLLDNRVNHGESSDIRGMGFFNNAVYWMGGYETPEPVETYGVGINLTAKEFAFFNFGLALHHVEDMSSPAHIHNDAHLTIFTSLFHEKDDYEAWWLPQQKITYGTGLDPFFSGSDQIVPIDNPWTWIWEYQKDGSLMKLVYDATTYSADLGYPLDEYTTYNVPTTHYFITNRAPDQAPTGELADMFPCINALGQYDENVDDCLYWENENLEELSHWRIKAVGDFHHQFDNGYHNNWWPIEYEEDTSPSTEDDPRVFSSGKYYIEQLSRDNSRENPIGTLVVPARMRSLLTDPSSPMIDNSESKPITEFYANNLLQPAVKYGAGFAQYWYDVANTPPYIVSLTTKQGFDDDDQPRAVYYSEWVDTVVHLNVYVTDVQRCDLWAFDCDKIQGIVSMVDSRERWIDYEKIAPINQADDLVITLTFNEPIRQISYLAIGAVDLGPSLKSAIKKENDTIWVITVPATDLAGLNGKQQLTIKARDKNNHRRGTECPDDGQDDTAGAELDGTPDTPARRNITLAMNLENRINCYPWYQEGAGSGTPDDNTAYSYDYADGDQNHWLVFDTAAPSGQISVNTTLQ